MTATARFSLWAPVVVWAAVIFAFSSIPGLGTGLGTWDLVLRKLAHAAEFAILGALLARALGACPGTPVRSGLARSRAWQERRRRRHRAGDGASEDAARPGHAPPPGLVGFLDRALGQPWIALAAGSLYAVTDELHQAFVSNRNASPIDWAIDTAGVAIGVCAWVLWRRRR